MRYLPHTDKEISEMLDKIGKSSVEELFHPIPKSCKTQNGLNLSKGISEQELTQLMLKLSAKNDTSKISFLGGGAYRHFIPAAVTELAGRAEFATPYTPYQPEISQGTLNAIFEYQTMICRITGMDVANASTYDGATGLAEACLMAKRITKKRTKIYICNTVHLEYREVTNTTLNIHENSTVEIPHINGKFNKDQFEKILQNDVAAVVVSYPNTMGIVEDFSKIAERVHEVGALFIVCVPEPLSLGFYEAPGNFGADIVVGEGLSFGLPLSFGGPTLGLFATREKYLRQMPGRICGRTTDANGRTGYVLTLSTREQHIRRERATSNICSNQALCATACAIYLSLLGKNGFSKLSKLNVSLAEYAKQKLCQINGIKLSFDAPTFNEFVIELPVKAEDLLAKLESESIYAGIPLGRWYKGMENHLLVCCTEMNSKDEIDLLAERIERTLQQS